ncbi:MAG: hypothetical protein IAF38_01965, partial [Bacteroidia bacterium]|nr:hypothetical protein [Bacteroidia bacterium]
MRKTKSILFFKKAIFLFALLFSFSAFSQLYNFKKYSTKNGLANSSVNCIIQNQMGYIWFGTQGGGLSRFDGKDFKNYTKIDGLMSNDLAWLCEDKSNNLWISTTEGLSFFDGKTFKNYGPSDGFSKETVYNTFCDSYGDLWIPTSANGLKIYRDKKFITIDSTNGLETNFIFCVFQKGDEYWVGTYRKGLFVLDRNGKVKRHYNSLAGNSAVSVFVIAAGPDGTLYLGTNNSGVYSMKNDEFKHIDVAGVEKDFIGSLIVDKRNNLWAATQHGLLKLSAEGHKLFQGFDGLSSEVVNALCEDYEGNMWIGTSGGGVNLLKRESIVTYSDRDGLSNNIITCIYRARDGAFFASALHGGLDYYDPAEGKFKLIKLDSDFENTSISSIVELSGNLLLVASEEKGLLLFERNYDKFKLIKRITHYKSGGDETDITVVLKIVKDGFGHVWAGSFGEGLFMLDMKGNLLNHFTKGKDGLLSKDIITLGVDLEGNLLASCNKEGVQIYKNGKFTLYDKTLPDIMKITWSTDTDLEKGNIYFGTQDGGLVICNKGKVKNYNTSNGLCSNYIQSVAISKGYVWLGTDKGVNRIKLNDANEITELRYFGTEDGFISAEINLNSIFVEKNGDVWFGSSDGLTKYIEKFDYPNVVSPKLILSDIKMFYENVNWSDYSDKVDTKTNIPLELTLPFNKNHLTFNFRALTVDNVQYKFFLEGLDDDWFPFSANNQAVYTNIH